MMVMEKTALEELREVCEERAKKVKEWKVHHKICNFLFDEIMQCLDNEQAKLLLKYIDEQEELHKIERNQLLHFALDGQ